MLHFSHMRSPKMEELPSRTSQISPVFQRALQDLPSVGFSQRTEAYARTADDTKRTPWESIGIKVPGNLDLQRHADIRSQDIPGKLDIEGNLIINADRLQDLSGHNINIHGNLVIIVPKGTRNISQIQEDAWVIDGIGIGGEVIVKEEISPTTEKPEHTTEDRSRALMHERLAAMTREQFAEYLITHRAEYAEFSGRPLYNKPDRYSEDDIYSLMIIKPSRRGKLMNAAESGGPEFNAQIAAKRRYETELVTRNNTWEIDHDRKESFVYEHMTVASDWGRWIINNGIPIHTEGKTPKGYITLKQATIDLTPKTITGIIDAVQHTGVSCQLKIPTSGTRATKLFDNIVIHCASSADVQKTIIAVQEFCIRQKNPIEIEGTETGEDAEGTSHSNLLAQRVRTAWKKQDEEKK